MRLIIPIAALLLGACTSLRARAYAGVQQTTLQGEAALNNSAGSLNLGTSASDIEDEVGLDGEEYSPYVRAELGIPLGSLTISGFDYTATGSGTLGAGHPYGDIPGGSQITSFLEFTNIKAAVHFDLLNFGVLRLSPGVGVDFINFDVQVTELNTANFERVDNEVFVPMLFAQAEVDLGVVAATVDVGYMQASLDDATGRYFDLEGLIRFNPVPFVEVFAGYRLIDLDARGTADERRYEADLRLHGWTLGGGVIF